MGTERFGPYDKYREVAIRRAFALQPGQALVVSDEGVEIVDELEDDQSEALEDLTVDQLKDLLKERDLPVSGNKSELIARLEDE